MIAWVSLNYSSCWVQRKPGGGTGFKCASDNLPRGGNSFGILPVAWPGWGSIPHGGFSLGAECYGAAPGVLYKAYQRQPGRSELAPLSVMFNENENKKSAQQGSCCGKLKFSMVRDMLVNREIEMDEPGVLTVVDMEGVNTQMEFDGLNVLSRKRSVLAMLNGAFAQLAKDGMEYNPKALAVLGEWWGRSIKDSEKIDLFKGLVDVLSK